MKKANVLLSIGSAILASRVARAISDFQVDGVLGRVGLQRNRSHVAENLAYLGIGALVGAGTALLLAPDSGSNTRARIGRKIDELGDAAANAVEAVENHVPGLRSNQLAADRQHH